MKKIKQCVCALALSALPLFGSSQNNILVESELTHEKKVVVVKYEKGSEASARYNGSNNNWELESDEFYSAKDIEELPLINPLTNLEDQELLKNDEIKLLDPLSLYKKTNGVETIVGKGSFKLEETLLNDLTKTQQIIVDNSNSTILTYTVFNNWYTSETKPKLIICILEKYVTVKNMGIYTNEKTFFLNNEVKSNAFHSSITKAYPVPADDEINFELFLKNRSEKVTLKIVDLTGNLVLKQELGSQPEGAVEYKLDINKLSSGNYISLLFIDDVVYDRKKISVIR